MNFISRLSLRNMLTLPYVALMLALTSVIGGLMYHAGRDAVNTWSDQLLIETVERIKQAVNGHVAGSAAVLEVAFPQGLSAPVSVSSDFEALRTRFWLATSVHRDPNNYAYYGDRDGQFFGLMRLSESEGELRLRLSGEGPRTIQRFTGIKGALGTPAVEERVFEPRERPWFKAGESRSRSIWTSIYLDFRTLELVATRARRVDDPAGGFGGVVATDLSLRQIDTFLRGLALSTNGVALVVEQNGDLIGVSRGSHLTTGPDGQPKRLQAKDSPEPLVADTYRAVSHLLETSPAGTSRTAVFSLPDGERVQVGYSRLRDDSGLDWVVMVAVPRRDFLQGVEASFRTSVVLAGLAALCVVALGLWILATIANELRALAQAARRIGEGDFGSPPSTQRTDEIGQLARSFNDMQSRLLTDQLTGLSNRAAIVRRIEERIHQQRRREDARPFVLLFADFNDFKRINDEYGHDVGDQVLRELALRLRDGVRSNDLVARFAGDEFLVMIEAVNQRRDGERARDHLEEKLRLPLESLKGLADGPSAGASIGMAVYPDDGRDIDTLLKRADEDMYARKRLGRDGGGGGGGGV